MTFFDTARTYGGGQSESYLAAGLGRFRETVVIATKFGPVPRVPDSSSGRPVDVRTTLEQSLAELQADYVDLYQMHFPDPETPIADTLGVLQDLVAEGKIRRIGCCNFDAAALSLALQTSMDGNLVSFVSSQIEYSLVNRAPESDGAVDVCDSMGISLLPYYPLGSGLLTGKTRRGKTPEGRLRTDRYSRFLTEVNFDLVDRLDAFATSRGVTMTQVALGWLLAQRTVPAVTPGASTATHIEDNAAAAEWHPSVDDLAVLAATMDPGGVNPGQ